MGQWGKNAIKTTYKCTQDALRLKSPKPDLAAVRDAFNHIIKIEIKFSSKPESQFKFNRQSYSLSVHSSRCPCVHFLALSFSLSSFYTPPSINSSTYSLFSTQAFTLPLSPLPPVLSSVSICSCLPPLLLSCHCCLLPLLSSSNYITAPVSRLQILTWPSDEHFCPPLSRSGFRLCDLILDTFLKVDRAWS